MEVVDTFTVLLSPEYFRLRFSPFVRLLVGSKIVKDHTEISAKNSHKKADGFSIVEVYNFIRKLNNDILKKA